MGVLTINSGEVIIVPETDTFTLAVTNATGFNEFRVLLTSPVDPTDLITIDWGDGTVDTGLSPSFNGHTYSTPYTGDITITVPDNIGRVRDLSQNSGTNMPFSFDLADITQLINLEQLDMTRPNTILGDINNLPPNIENIIVRGTNTISGDVGTLSTNIQASLINFEITGQNTLTGDISTVFDNIRDLIVSGNNTLFGNVDSFTNFRRINISGNNTISGTINNFPDTIFDFDLSGNNTITGDIINFPTTATNFVGVNIQGNNTVVGNLNTPGLPTNSLGIISPGSNIFGDISVLPLGFFLVVTGTGNVTGNFNQLQGNINVLNTANTVGGDLSGYTISGSTVQITVDELSQEVTYNTSRLWSVPSVVNITLRNNINGAFTPAMVDQFLIDLNNSTFVRGPSAIRLTGGFSRTTASDAAFTQLDSDGVIVLIT